MKIRKLLIAMLCMAFAMAMTACGGSKQEEAGDTGKEEEEVQEEADDPTIEISGAEVTSGTLTVTVPEGWEVCPNERDNNWEANEQYKLLETANKKDSAGNAYGSVYIEFRLSDYSDIANAYNEDALKENAKEYKDEENGLPKEYTFNDNTYLGFRNYGYVGDSAEDWTYLCYAADGSLIELRAYVDGDLGTDENSAAMDVIMASLKIGGEPVSVSK